MSINLNLSQFAFQFYALLSAWCFFGVIGLGGVAFILFLLSTFGIFMNGD